MIYPNPSGRPAGSQPTCLRWVGGLLTQRLLIFFILDTKGVRNKCGLGQGVFAQLVGQ